MESPLLRASLRRTLALLETLLAWSHAAVATTAAWTVAQTKRTLETLHGWLATVHDRSRRLAAGPLRDLLAGPVKRGLLGRHVALSSGAVLAAPVLALGANWWVVRTSGFDRIEQMLRGTWYGTDPHAVVFLAGFLLVATAAVYAAANSGLLPTTLLVSAPIFGAAFSVYGTVNAAGVVSLPDAVAVATGVAILFGIPIALAGFAVGLALRRVATLLRGRTGPGWRPDEV
jgi:hypothetical protein